MYMYFSSDGSQYVHVLHTVINMYMYFSSDGVLQSICTCTPSNYSG